MAACIVSLSILSVSGAILTPKLSGTNRSTNSTTESGMLTLTFCVPVTRSVTRMRRYLAAPVAAAQNFRIPAVDPESLARGGEQLEGMLRGRVDSQRSGMADRSIHGALPQETTRRTLPR